MFRSNITTTATVLLGIFLASVLCWGTRTAAADLPAGFPAEAFWYDGKWAQEHSGLPADPGISYGRMANGFRYAIIPHTKSADRVSVYLDVQAGSLMENESQLGYAHYVEHMAFNGSRNFPAGSLIPFFQKNGMSFGGDTNAHTSLMETVYKINLASNTKDSLRDALLVLRDFADGILFDEKEVSKELGVILAEKTARNNEAALSRVQRQNFLYPQTKFVNEVIGTEATLRAATSRKLSDFYTTWYRPERMVLVVVGNVSKADVEPLITAAFGSMEKKEQAAAVAPWGNPANQGFRVLSERRTLEGAELAVMLHFPRVHNHDSRQVQKDNFIDAIIEHALQRRLQLMGQEDAELWNAARLMNRNRRGLLPSVTFSASTKKENWQNALRAGAREMRRMELYGITRQELDAAAGALQKKVQRYKNEYPSLENQKIADNFVAAVNADRVYTSVDFDVDLIRQLSTSVTLEEVNAEAKRIFSNSNITVIVGSATPPQENDITTVWGKSRAAEVTPYEAKQRVAFPYLPLPETIITKNLPALQSSLLATAGEYKLTLHKAILPNTVEFYAISLPFAKDKVQIQLLFGSGYRELSGKEITLAQASGMVLRGSGPGKLTPGDSRLLAEELGGSVQESYGLSVRSISIEGDAVALEKLLQAVWTQYLDPHPEQQAFLRAGTLLQNQDFKNETTVEGMANTQGTTFFYGDARRYKSLNSAEFSTITFPELTEFIKRNRYCGPVKILISGQVQPAEAYALAAQYFGKLAPEPARHGGQAAALTFPEGKTVSRKVKDSVDQATLRLAWHMPNADIYDRKTMTARQIAASLLRDRLREDLREKMGAAYSPSCVYRVLPQENGFALLQVTVKTDAARLEEVTGYVKALKSWQVTQEDLQRLRAPILTAWNTSRTTNAKWQRLLASELQYNLPYVQWENDYKALVLSVTPEEVSAALREMLASPQAIWRVHSSVKGK